MARIREGSHRNPIQVESASSSGGRERKEKKKDTERRERSKSQARLVTHGERLVGKKGDVQVVVEKAEAHGSLDPPA